MNGLALIVAVFVRDGVAQEPPARPARILFLKQDITQYNQVFERARAVLRRSRPNCVIESHDLPRGGATEATPAPGASYDKIVSLGTPAFEAAMKRYPDQHHYYGMIVTLKRSLLAAIPEARRTRIRGASILSQPSAYIAYAREIHPGLRSIGMLYASDDLGDFVKGLRREAKEAGVNLVVEKVDAQKNMVRSFNRITKANIDVFFILPDFSLYDLKAIEHVILNTFKRGIPCIGPSENFVKSGALWAFTIDPNSVGTQIGELVANDHAAEGDTVTYYRPTTIALNVLVMENLDLDVPFRIRKNAKLIDPRTQNEE